jgi:DNA polymerase III epsilon subunit-like protein
MARCSGTTKKNTRCTITGASSMTDSSGRLVSQPLRRGGAYCALHAKPFILRPAAADVVVVVFLDLETTGVDIARDRIVELAATHAPTDARAMGGSYSTTVWVEPHILQERGAEAATVHGISDEEIALGPGFSEAWARFLHWTECLLNTAIEGSDADTDDDEAQAPRPEETPVLLLAAHNGVRFDFPLLLCEVLRHGLSGAPFESWLFVDTLAVLQAVQRHGCMKLQCLSQNLMAETGRAHRALDDCASLRQVMVAAALILDTPLPALMKRFGQELDMPSSVAQLSFLMDDA